MYFKVHYVESSKDPYYGRNCSKCNKWVTTRRSIVIADTDSVGTAAIVIHRSCLEELLEKGPNDLDVEKVDKIVEEEKGGSGLLAWIMSSDDD